MQQHLINYCAATVAQVDSATFAMPAKQAMFLNLLRRDVIRADTGGLAMPEGSVVKEM
jgi:hypothetical protein